MLDERKYASTFSGREAHPFTNVKHIAMLLPFSKMKSTSMCVIVCTKCIARYSCTLRVAHATYSVYFEVFTKQVHTHVSLHETIIACIILSHNI